MEKSAESPAGAETNVISDELLYLYDMQLRSIAGHFPLWEDGGRAQSAKALTEFFFGLTKMLSPRLFVEISPKATNTSLHIRERSPGTRVVAFEQKPSDYK